MEKNIKQKLLEYETNFKNNIQKWLEENKVSMYQEPLLNNAQKECTNDFLQHLNDFPCLELTQQDFQKRKRIKNNVPDYNRCIAVKCNGERCSRKQKDKTTHFCGTHMKGSPHGTISNNEKVEKKTQITLELREINGIDRYIDDNNNVYSTNDIKDGVNPPKVIFKYDKKEDGTYFIVES
tara:strand:- start:80 stop:619 length:540 start_codon:yes stop_codon:yes gene_type:complete